MKKNSLKCELDGTDLALLRLVQDDGRLSNVKIAEKLALSETPCWRRLKRLEAEGYISGYQANLDRHKLGFGVLALVRMSFACHTDETPNQFEEAVQNIPEVRSCHIVTGEEDYFLEILVPDLAAYEELQRNVLRNLPGVTAIKTSFSLREIKATSRLPLE